MTQRISFGHHEMGHLYEMALEHMCTTTDNCGVCSHLQGRIEKFLGPKEVRSIKKILRKNGYCNKLKS